MAYLTLTDDCDEGRHDQCPGSENMPEAGYGGGTEVGYGGGICICKCHTHIVALEEALS